VQQNLLPSKIKTPTPKKFRVLTRRPREREYPTSMIGFTKQKDSHKRT
jgi:hypothetical protein